MAKASATSETLAVRELIKVRREDFEKLLEKYGASNPLLFGSVARGTAGPRSDVDIFPAQLLQKPISDSAIQEAVAL